MKSLKKLGIIFIMIGLLINIQTIINTNRNLINAKGSEITMVTKELKPDDFQIGGLKLEQTISEVKRILGKPKKIGATVIYKENVNKNNWECYYYSGVQLEVSKKSKKVYDITVNKAGLKTPRGIGVGSIEKDVISKYGEAEKVDDYLNYQKYDSKINASYSMDFLIEKGKVKQIQIYYAWD